MADNRKEQERAELHRTIWNIANDLRGSVDGWDFKQYVLGMLFYRYISENLTDYINRGEHEAGNKDFDYAKLTDSEAEEARMDLVHTKGFFILPSELFENVRKKAAGDENSSRQECGNIMVQIIQYHIFLDVCHNQLVFFFPNPGSISQEGFDLRGFVQEDIFGGRINRPGVNVDGRHFPGTEFGCQDGQYTGAAPHVEHSQGMLGEIEHGFHHQEGGLMIPGAESHPGFNYDFNGAGRYVGMERGAYHHPVPDQQRPEIVFFPHFIPVLRGNGLLMELDVELVSRSFAKPLQAAVIKFIFGDIGFKSVFGFHERVKSLSGQLAG